MKRIFGGTRYANVTASLALIVALSGTAYAANSIRSGDIKNGQVKAADLATNSVRSSELAKKSVRSSEVKNKSLRAVDFKDGQIPAGPPGTPGQKGDKGARGPSDGFSTRSGTNVLGWVANTDQTVASLALPAGKFVVTGKVVANNNEAAARQVDCSLNLNTTVVDNLFGDAGLDVQGASTDDRVVMALTGAGTLSAPGTANLLCRANGATGNWIARSITAIQVATLNGG